MSSDVLLILQTVISNCWYLFVSWRLPGLHATPGSLALFVLAVYVVLKFFKRIARLDDSDK